MWALTTLAAAAFSAQGLVFGYNESLLGANKVTVSYITNNTETLAERNPRNGFYKVNLDNIIDMVDLGETPLKWKKIKSIPFLIVSKSGNTIISGFWVSDVAARYFNSNSEWGDNPQTVILPDPDASKMFSTSSFDMGGTVIANNLIYTNFDGSAEYTINPKWSCPGNPRSTTSPCLAVSPDNIYGKGNAFMTYYFYSASKVPLEPLANVISPSWLFPTIATDLNPNIVCPPSDVMRRILDDDIIRTAATEGPYCKAGDGLTYNVDVCSVFGTAGSLAYGKGYKQLDANVTNPLFAVESRFDDPTFTCLPWSVIQGENVEYVLDGMGYDLEDATYDWKRPLLNLTNKAGTGCQNFEINSKVGSNMYCPVMWRPWQWMSPHTVIDPDKVLTYTNSTNGQTYFFWMAQCYNTLDLTLDIYKQAVRDSCAPCPPGKYSTGEKENDDTCIPAPQGTRAPGSGNAQPVPCNASLFEYTNKTGSTECLKCTGVSGVTGASYQVHSDGDGLGISCTPEYCLRGQFFNLATELCENCTSGTYTKDTISRGGCLPCTGNGTLLTMKNGYAVGCQCVPGYGGLGPTQQDETSRGQCERCTGRTYSDANTDINIPCKVCLETQNRTQSQAGSWANSNNTLCVCQKGFHGPSGDGSACEICGVGEYTSDTGQLNCSACSAGTYQNERGESSCIQCSLGTYTSSSGKELCTPCRAGTATDPDSFGSRRYLYYTSGAGKTECLPCNEGRYQDQMGKGGCLSCVAGTYASSEGESLCKACTRGTYQNQTKATTNCIECNAGDYQQDQGQTVCEKCQGGSYSADAGATSCTVCSPGAYQGQSEQSDCKECTGGTYQGQRAQLSCRTCIVGTYSGAKATICTECERGKYQDSPGNSQCKECAAGTYTDQTKSTDCIGCTPGKFQEEAGQTKCESCPEGTYTYSGDVSLGSCSPCPIGTYGNEEGATTCKACFLGAYSYNEGSISCSVNKVNQRSVTASQGSPATFCRNNNNTHAPYNGLTTCLKCYPGTFHPYSVGGDAKVCELCPAGTYQDEFGSPDCKLCPSNQRGLKEGQYQCACAPGSYDVAKIDYPPQCQRCGGQEYQDEVGSREGCKTCEDFYMPLPGHQGCVPIYEEVTDTCLMVFWRRECYSKGVHPITIALWLVVLVLVYQIGKALFKETRHAILDSK